MKIESHRDLRVWQDAMDAAMRIFEITKHFPQEEKYSLTDQVRRASRSVATNIAEAWRKRRYRAAFVAKLNDSEGEAAETQTWIEFSLRCHYLPPERAQELNRLYERILGHLVQMIKDPASWTVGPQRGGNAP